MGVTRLQIPCAALTLGARLPRTHRSLPASALDEDSDDEDDGAAGGMSPVNDDEKTGTRYNYSYFHVIFVLATMYTACLLTKCVARICTVLRRLG